MAGEADLYFEVLSFYARQLRLLEERQVEQFARTFTEDGVFEHASGMFKLSGRAHMIEQTTQNVQRYGETAFRHWQDKLVVVPQPDDTIQTTFTAMVSLTEPDGRVSFEPTCTVADVLVRHEGQLLTKHRLLAHDVPDLARVWAGQLT